LRIDGEKLRTPEADEETGREEIYPIVVEVQFMCLDRLRVALSAFTLLEDVLSRISRFCQYSLSLRPLLIPVVSLIDS
jgi:hypothetical protein